MEVLRFLEPYFVGEVSVGLRIWRKGSFTPFGYIELDIHFAL